MRFSRLKALDCDEAVDHAVEVVEEGQQVEGKFDPPLPLQVIKLEMHILKWFIYLALVQGVRVHDGGWIVETSSRHHRTVHVPDIRD